MSIWTCQNPADKFGFGLIKFGFGRFDDQKGTINKVKINLMQQTDSSSQIFG
jgi:hypothetical protein